MAADPGPVEEKHKQFMTGLAKGLDKMLNPDFPRTPKRYGFVVLIFEFGEDPKGRCNYISNAARPEIIQLLREQANYFEETLKDDQPGTKHGNEAPDRGHPTSGGGA